MENDFFGGFTALTAGLSNPGGNPEKNGVTKINSDNIVAPPNGAVAVPPPLSIQEPEFDKDGNPIPPSNIQPIPIEPVGGEPIIAPPVEDPELDEDGNPIAIEPVVPTVVPPVVPEEFTFGDSEPEMAEFVQEQLYEKFGIELKEDTEKFESFDDVTNFVMKAIDENSLPAFADERVAAIDEYVRNGGTLENFMGAVHSGVNIDTVDLNNEKDQIAVIREDLTNQGVSESRIKRRLERLEDSAMLAEEAEDSLESVKEYKGFQQERLLTEQQNLKASQEEANNQYIRSVQDELKGMEELLGVPVTDKERRDTFNFIFQSDANGVTPLQQHLNSSVKNVIETAFFLKNGGKLNKAIEKKATSSAAKKLKNKLANNKKRGGGNAVSSSNDSDTWGLLSKQLRRF